MSWELETTVFELDRLLLTIVRYRNRIFFPREEEKYVDAQTLVI